MRKGFTLIEVLTVVAIIGILATITTYAYQSSLIRSRDYQRLSDMESIKNALEQFYLDNRFYPQVQDSPKTVFSAKWQLERIGGTNCGNYEPSKKFLAPNYMTSIPQDPIKKFDRNGECDNENAGQYLYTITGPEDKPATFTTPRSYYLMAKMERKNNKSKTMPTQNQLEPYGPQFFGGAGIVLCQANTNPSQDCTQNYFLSNIRSN